MSVMEKGDTASPPGDAEKNRTRVVASGLAVAGFVISFLGSWIPSLWTDEAATISGSDRSLSELWAMAHNIDAVHTAYYFFMHGWTDVFGSSAMSLRLPSALAVGLATAGVYILGLRLTGPAVALWASVIFIVLPRVTWMGGEARPWAFTTAAGVLMTLLLVLLLDPSDQWWTGRRRVFGWIAYAILTAIAIMINIYLVFLLLAHGVTHLVAWKRVRPSCRWAWAGSAAAASLLSAPIVLMASGQSGQLGGERFGVLQMLRNIIVNQYGLGETPTVSGDNQPIGLAGLFSDGGWRVGSLALGAALTFLAIFAVASALVAGRTAPLQESGRAAPASLLAWVLPWILVPTLLLAGYAVVVKPLYSPRYLSFTTPAMALLVAVGLAAIRLCWLRLAMVAVMVLATLPIYVSQRQVNSKSGSDWSEVAAVVRAGSRPGDAVYFAPRFPEQGATYGQSTRGIAIAYPEQFADTTDLTLQESAVGDHSLTGRSVRLQQSPGLNSVDRIWVIRRNGDPAGTESQDDETLRDNGFSVRQSWTGTLDDVRLFER